MGVMRTPTRRQATNAPVTALVPTIEIATQREAWASIPIRMGIGSIRQGMAKKVPYAATATAAAKT
jgi:hypothetical protein